MSSSDPVKAWIAEKLEVHPEQVVSYDFMASPGRVWSEYTEEGFDCTINIVMRDGNQRVIFLSEEETCDFLNDFWKLTAGTR